MYDLALDDATMQLNQRYGFNNTVAVLKAKDFDGFSVVLILHVRMHYFSAGRANMRTKRTYSVEVVSPNTTATSFDRYNMASKAEASKYFTHLTKQFTEA
jgi:hypothetical protein